MSKDVLKLALDDLMAEYCMERTSFAKRVDEIFKQALEQPAQEPVALEMDGKQLTLGEALDEAIAATERSASKRLNTVLVAAKNAIYTPPPAQPAPVQPVAMRMPKVGDRVVCIDDESLGTVVYLTAGGSPEIKFDDGSHGTYMVREFAELFGYTTPPAAAVQEPVGNWIWSWLMDWCKLKGISPATQDSLFAMVKDARNKFESTTPTQEFICSTGLCHYKPAAPVQSLPFGVGGGLVAIKTLLSRDPCVHANTAIEMIDAILKEHPAAQPAPVQPVGRVCFEGDEVVWIDEPPESGSLLYTTPPAQEIVCSTGLCHYKPAAQRPWVGLTAGELDALFTKHYQWDDYGKAIEAKLKEKNT
jgi:hypothetical protein